MPRLPTIAAALLAATPIFAQSPPSRGGSTDALSKGLIAVLEFKSKLKDKEIDAAYLADVVRGAAKRALPQAQIITRDNLLTLLEASGRKLEDCVGECEVESGRRIGADLIVSGDVLLVPPRRLKVSMRLHETRSGHLIGTGFAQGNTAEQLDDDLERAALELFAPLRPKAGSAVPQVSVGPSATLPDVPALPGQLQQGGAVNLDVDADVLVAYDRARSADERGKEKPDDAAAAWRAVASLGGKNPYKEEAATRQKQWETFGEKKRVFEKQLADDTEKLRKVLPLRSVPEPLKLELLVRYARLYGEAAARPFLTTIEAGPARKHAEAALGCEAKGAAQCEEMARLADSAGDPNRAATYLERACEAGGAAACERLGDVYLSGKGVDRDTTRAIAMLDRGCGAGRAAACSRLARVYEEGDGVKADTSKSLPLREKACAANDRDSCARLAAAYDGGLQVSRDEAKAEQLWRRACQLRHTAACTRVAEIDKRAAVERAERQRKEAAERAERLRVEREKREAREAIQREERKRRAEIEAAQATARRYRRIGYLLAGTGALAGATGGFFAYSSGQQNDKIMKGGFNTGRDIQTALDEGKSQNRLAVIFAIGSVVALGSGVALILTHPEPAPKLKVSLGPGALLLSGSFP